MIFSGIRVLKFNCFERVCLCFYANVAFVNSYSYRVLEQNPQNIYLFSDTSFLGEVLYLCICVVVLFDRLIITERRTTAAAAVTSMRTTANSEDAIASKNRLFLVYDDLRFWLHFFVLLRWQHLVFLLFASGIFFSRWLFHFFRHPRVGHATSAVRWVCGEEATDVYDWETIFVSTYCRMLTVSR